MIKLPYDITFAMGISRENDRSFYIRKEDIPKLKKWLVEYEMNND